MSNRIFWLRYYRNTAPSNRNAITDNAVCSVVTVFCKIKQQNAISFAKRCDFGNRNATTNRFHEEM